MILWFYTRRCQIAFLLVALFIVLTYRDYGITFDEEVHLKNGDYVIGWYLSGFQMDSAVQTKSSQYYGGMADAPIQFLADGALLLFNCDIYETRHLLHGFIGLVGLYYAFRLGVLIVGLEAGGWLAALLLLFTPRYFFGAFNNPKDIPFAVTYLAAIYYMAKALMMGKVTSGRVMWKIGLMVGMALGIRIGGMLLFPVLVQMVVIDLYSHWKERGTENWEKHLYRIMCCIGLVVGVAWLVMLLAWPYVQLDPFVRPFQVMDFMAHNPWDGRIQFFGKVLLAKRPPGTYLPVWLGITLPEFYHLGLAATCIAFVLKYLHPRDTRGRMRGVWLIVTAIILPIAVAIILHSTVYDGIRHFIFIIPLLAVLISWGMIFVWRRILWNSLRWGVVLSFGVIVLVLVGDLIELHPYESIYFNRTFAGGLPAVAERFGSDYWGMAYKEGAAWLKDHNKIVGMTNVGVPFMGKRLTYYFDPETYNGKQKNVILRAMGLGKWQVPVPEPRYHIVGPDENVEEFVQGEYPYFMAGTRMWVHLQNSGPILFEVRRQGTLLLVIRDALHP